MATKVRIFSHSGLVTAHVSAGGRFASDSVGLLKYPYLGKESLTATTGSAQSSAAGTAPDATKVLNVQVEEGKAVHIEVNPPNRTTAATVGSPIIRGDNIFNFGESWTISVLEHTVT